VVSGASRCRRPGCRAVGYDIDPEYVRLGGENAARFAPAGLVTIVQSDVCTLDLREADVVMLYLSPELNERLLPQLAGLKPGSRVASHSFLIPGVIPNRVVAVPSVEDDLVHTVYVWTAPLKKTLRQGEPSRRLSRLPLTDSVIRAGAQEDGTDAEAVGR
jgi:hypothetical protein